MVSRLKNCPGIFKNFEQSIWQKIKGEIFSNGRKHLSEMAPPPKKLSLFREKLEELVKWYDEFTGMDEVRETQTRVLEDEQRFKNSQEQRRQVLSELNDIKNRISDVHSELDSTNRGDERYLALITQEHQLLKEERRILEKFTMAEERERNSFAALSSSVKLSHEKERAQSERTKYWSIIGSIMGTVIGIVGTSINNYFKMNELKELIKNSSDKLLIDSLKNYLESNEKLFEKIKLNERSSGLQAHISHDFLKNLNSKLSNMEVSLQKIEQNNPYVVNENGKEYVSKISLDGLHKSLKEESSHTKMMLITIVVLSILMPLITRYT